MNKGEKSIGVLEHWSNVWEKPNGAQYSTTPVLHHSTKA